MRDHDPPPPLGCLSILFYVHLPSDVPVILRCCDAIGHMSWRFEEHEGQMRYICLIITVSDFVAAYTVQAATAFAPINTTSLEVGSPYPVWYALAL